jgi:glycosyltransferase involved in cell wall biosynthesis
MANLQNLAVSILSNSPGTPTGYGVQVELLAHNLLHSGAKVAVFSNYGLEGQITHIDTPFGRIEHYPRGLRPYSDDVLPHHYNHFKAKYPHKKHILMTLYDVWVLQNPALNELPIYSWTPLDHITMPPAVEGFLRKDNVHPIAMAPFGQRELEEKGIEHSYVPHAYDPKKYQPTNKIGNTKTREFMGIDEDDFLVGMVAANKANGQIHRKAYAENFMAFSILLKDNPNAKLYVHADPSKAYGGFDLGKLAKAVGIPQENLLFPDPLDLRYGFSPEHMAALYSTMDVLLAPSYGEGFGVPTVEAQACGTRVIGSDWAATPDLISEDGFVVDGQPFWDEAQSSWYMIPKIPSIVKALQQATEEERHSQTSADFALQFSNQNVWTKYWKPFFEGIQTTIE